MLQEPHVFQRMYVFLLPLLSPRVPLRRSSRWPWMLRERACRCSHTSPREATVEGPCTPEYWHMSTGTLMRPGCGLQQEIPRRTYLSCPRRLGEIAGQRHCPASCRGRVFQADICRLSFNSIRVHRPAGSRHPRSFAVLGLVEVSSRKPLPYYCGFLTYVLAHIDAYLAGLSVAACPSGMETTLK